MSKLTFKIIEAVRAKNYVAATDATKRLIEQKVSAALTSEKRKLNEFTEYCEKCHKQLSGKPEGQNAFQVPRTKEIVCANCAKQAPYNKYTMQRVKV